MVFKKGDQVMYDPRDVGDARSNQVELGFVMGRADKWNYFVRYWSKNNPALLRTAANSERAPAWALKPYTYKPQIDVDLMITKIEQKS